MAEDSTPKVIDYEALKKRPQTRTKAPNFVSIYANSMNAEATFSDVKIYFGEITEASQERLAIEDKVSIVMSPEHAKSVLKALGVAIKGYEDSFGPIRTVPGDNP